MSTYFYVLICSSALFIQNISSQYVRKRTNYDPVIGPCVPITPYMYSDVDVATLIDPYFPGPAILVPEQAYVTECASPVCACGGNPWPEYRRPTTYCGGYGNFDVQSAAMIEEPVIEAPPPVQPPLITAVGFGGDALALALSPLLDATDADVALLMFTKVKTC